MKYQREIIDSIRQINQLLQWHQSPVIIEMRNDSGLYGISRVWTGNPITPLMRARELVSWLEGMATGLRQIPLEAEHTLPELRNISTLVSAMVDGVMWRLIQDQYGERYVYSKFEGPYHETTENYKKYKNLIYANIDKGE